MDEQAPRKRGTRFTRAARAARILERVRDGLAYADVAREEKITVRRVQQIVAGEIKRRETDEGATHANLQLDRLGYAMRVACEALAEGDVKAIAPFVKVIDRLDRYQELAREAAPPRTRSRGDELVVREMVRRIRESAALASGRPRGPAAPGCARGSAASGRGADRPSPGGAPRRAAASERLAPEFFPVRSPLSP